MRQVVIRRKNKWTGLTQVLTVPYDWLSDEEKQELDAKELSAYDEKECMEAQNAEQNVDGK